MGYGIKDTDNNPIKVMDPYIGYKGWGYGAKEYTLSGTLNMLNQAKNADSTINGKPMLY